MLAKAKKELESEYQGQLGIIRAAMDYITTRENGFRFSRFVEESGEPTLLLRKKRAPFGVTSRLEGRLKNGKTATIAYTIMKSLK